MREFFEKRFGRDLSEVRVHTGSEVDEAADSLGARAFTVGNDIAVRGRDYRPGSRSGRRLLAHELDHVIRGGDGKIGPATDKIYRQEDGDAGRNAKDGGEKAAASRRSGREDVVELPSQVVGDVDSERWRSRVQDAFNEVDIIYKRLKAIAATAGAAYETAWNNVDGVLKKVFKQIKARRDLMLNIVTTVATGLIGKAVGGVFEKAVSSNGYAVTGAEELAKALSGQGMEAAAGSLANKTYRPVGPEPYRFQASVVARLNNEEADVKAAIQQLRNDPGGHDPFPLIMTPFYLDGFDRSFMRDGVSVDRKALADEYELEIWTRWLRGPGKSELRASYHRQTGRYQGGSLKQRFPAEPQPVIDRLRDKFGLTEQEIFRLAGKEHERPVPESLPQPETAM